MIFGNQNNQSEPADSQNPLAVDPATGASLPATVEPSDAKQPEDNSLSSGFGPFDPPNGEQPEQLINDDLLEPASAPATVGDDLLSLKQQALQELTPLVDHLEQSPEEKFRTTLMMIQATDNQALIKSAYETAQQISDEKVRARALLDLINEINYFTQQKTDKA